MEIKPDLWMSILLKYWALYFHSIYGRVVFSRWGRLNGHLCFHLCYFFLFLLFLIGPTIVLVSYALEAAAAWRHSSSRKALRYSIAQECKCFRDTATCLGAVVLRPHRDLGWPWCHFHLLCYKGPIAGVLLLHIGRKKEGSLHAPGTAPLTSNAAAIVTVWIT